MAPEGKSLSMRAAARTARTFFSLALPYFRSEDRWIARALLGGIVVVESVFQYPGLGQGLAQAVAARDIPVVQAISMLIAIVYIAINVLADLIVVLLIPRLRTSQ